MCPAAAEVKGSTSRPAVLLRTVDPCDRPLDPAYPWAPGEGDFPSGPGAVGGGRSSLRGPGARGGQGPNKRGQGSSSAGRFMLRRSLLLLGKAEL